MNDAIRTYNLMSELHASIGRMLQQDAEFTVYPTEEIESQAPFGPPLFRTNFYSIVIIRKALYGFQGSRVLVAGRRV